MRRRPRVLRICKPDQLFRQSSHGLLPMPFCDGEKLLHCRRARIASEALKQRLALSNALRMTNYIVLHGLDERPAITPDGKSENSLFVIRGLRILLNFRRAQ